MRLKPRFALIVSHGKNTIITFLAIGGHRQGARAAEEDQRQADDLR